MDALHWDHHPQLRRPVLIAAFEGWADAGDAASAAAGYLATTWGARPFASLDPEEFYDFTETRPRVRLDEEGRRQIDWPANTFAAASAPGSAHDVIVLQGVEPQLKWRAFTGLIVEVVQSLRVELVLSLGALLADVPHTRPVRVTGTSADDGLAAKLELQRSRYQGPTGIVSVLHDALARSGTPSASLWAAVPHYISETPSPKATLALVRRTADVLGAGIDASDLEIAAASYERQVSEVVAADDDVAAYVSRLEEAAEEDDELPLVPADGDSLAAEVEEFLREHRTD
ncbi:MAG TPA: PAC2 family protein [Acidimicrobiales bacterium]|nr:PAC2 family protein [Acidimicrobiales bacterium]